jgi:hypothetical protein
LARGTFTSLKFRRAVPPPRHPIRPYTYFTSTPGLRSTMKALIDCCGGAFLSGFVRA